MSRQFRSDDTDKWKYGFGKGGAGSVALNTSTDAPIDSACSGTATQQTLSATNASFASGQLVMIHQTRGTGVGNYEFNKIDAYGAGTISLKHALQNTYTNSGASCAQVVVGTEYDGLTINAGQTVTAKAWNGTVGGIYFKFAKGTIQVDGNISANTCGYRAGAGAKSGNGSVAAQGTSGEGTANAQQSSTAANGSGGGGGWAGGNSSGGCWIGGGGSGGHASSGYTGLLYNSAPNPVGGAGGGVVGNAGLTNMVFGGAGGGDGISGGCNTQSNGGNSGGIVCLIAKNIVITGTITTNGGAGTQERGGGGSGGSVLLKCQTATLGTNKITCAGGAGGSQQSGNVGSAGRIHIDYKDSYTGTATPAIDARQDATLKYVAGASILKVLTN